MHYKDDRPIILPKVTEDIHDQELCRNLQTQKITDLDIKITVDKKWPHKMTPNIISAFKNCKVKQSSWRKTEFDKEPTRKKTKANI